MIEASSKILDLLHNKNIVESTDVYYVGNTWLYSGVKHVGTGETETVNIKDLQVIVKDQTNQIPPKTELTFLANGQTADYTHYVNTIFGEASVSGTYLVNHLKLPAIGVISLITNKSDMPVNK